MFNLVLATCFENDLIIIVVCHMLTHKKFNISETKTENKADADN